MRPLPIVERELRVRARLASTAWSRTVLAAVAVLVVSYALFGSAGMWSQGRIGQEVFQVLSWLALVFLLLEGVRLTHGTLSDERREGTLGLLFLTPLRGIDVVLGKLAASGLTAIYGVLATVPALAITLIVGGVTLGEVGRAALVLLNTLFAALNLGLWVSSRAEDDGRALMQCLGWLIAWMGVPWLVETAVHGGTVPLSESSLALLSPAAGLLLSDATVYASSGGQWRYWAGLVVIHVLAWSLLLLAARRTAVYRSLGTWPRALPVLPPKRRSAIRSFSGREHPVHWLATRDGRRRRRAWLAAGCMLAPTLVSLTLVRQLGPGNMPLAVFMGSNLFLYLVAAVILASLVCRPLTEARESGTLELLLTTPIPVSALVKHYWGGIFRVIFPPLLTVQLLQSATQYGLSRWAGSATISFRFDLWSQAVGLAHAVAYLFALIWTGIWLAASLRKPGQAILRTVLWVTVLPYAVAYLQLPIYRLAPAFGLPPSLFISLISLGPVVVLILLWRWNRKRVQTRLRQAITQDPAGPRERPPPGQPLRQYIEQARRWQAD